MINSMNTEHLGYIAGSFVAISVLPQVIKSWQTKSTNDLSLYWSVINLIGQCLWIIFGILINSNSLVIMSGITLFFQLTMIYLKLKYG